MLGILASAQRAAVTSKISPVASAFVILYVGYEATTHALLWTQFDGSHNRGDCRSATNTDLENVPHLSDEGQLLSTNTRAEFRGHCSLYNRFGIFGLQGRDRRFKSASEP